MTTIEVLLGIGTVLGSSIAAGISGRKGATKGVEGSLNGTASVVRETQMELRDFIGDVRDRFDRHDSRMDAIERLASRRDASIVARFEEMRAGFDNADARASRLEDQQHSADVRTTAHRKRNDANAAALKSHLTDLIDARAKTDKEDV